jgi:hypothetical protein
MTVHPDDCDCPTYGCMLRRKGIRLGYDASQTARARRPFRPPVSCSENAGLAGEHRPGGFFSPFVGERSLRRVHTKEGRERRREINESRRAAYAGASPKE